MPRKPARPSPSRRVSLLEDDIVELLLLLQERACEFIPRLRKTPREDWCLYAGAAFFYIVAHSIGSFITPAQWKRIQPRYVTVLDRFTAAFGDVRGEMAALHEAVTQLRQRYAQYRTPENDAQDIIIQAGLWPLQRSLGWKKMPLKHVMPVAMLGNLLWGFGAHWFDPASHPRETPPGDEADLLMAILGTLNRLARDEQIDAEQAPPA